MTIQRLLANEDHNLMRNGKYDEVRDMILQIIDEIRNPEAAQHADLSRLASELYRASKILQDLNNDEGLKECHAVAAVQNAEWQRYIDEKNKTINGTIQAIKKIISDFEYLRELTDKVPNNTSIFKSYEFAIEYLTNFCNQSSKTTPEWIPAEELHYALEYLIHNIGSSDIEYVFYKKYMIKPGKAHDFEKRHDDFKLKVQATKNQILELQKNWAIGVAHFRYQDINIPYDARNKINDVTSLLNDAKKLLAPRNPLEINTAPVTDYSRLLTQQ